MEGLDLPDWTQGLLIERSGIDCSPPKKPLAQVTLKDGNTQRVSALGRPGAAAFKPAYPVPTAVPPPVVLPAAGHFDTENDASAAADAAAHPPHSAPRRTHTPSRTGLTAKAVRMPSRLGLTPGAKQPEQFAVPAGGQMEGKGAGAPPATAGVGNLKSILKRLNFSQTKGRAAAAATTDASASSALHRQPAAVAAGPESTIKQLRFDAGTTPAAGTAAKPAGGGRHVSFDAATVSPAARSRPAHFASGSSGTLPAAAWRTPEPTIQEEDSGSSGAGEEDNGSGPAGGSVNSARAGHTPYDRRLSSLFRKYQVAGTPELPDAELDDLVAGGAVSSPSWNRLSSASVPESIRELSKKYTSDMEGSGCEGLTPPHQGASMASPSSAADMVDDAEAATPVQAGAAGRSPTLDPTPHHVLDSIMRCNALYESPPDTQEVAVGPAAVEHPASEDLPAVQVPASSGALSPRSAVAQLLGPMLRATLDEIDADKAAAGTTAAVEEQQRGQEEALPAASPPPTVAVAMSPGSSAKFSSPADFYGFPAMATPGGTAGGVAPSVHDSVPRDSEGVPIVTPATVTVRRGSYAGRREGVLEEDDLAANLFNSTFSPSDSLSGVGGSPGFGSEVLEFGGFAASTSLQEQAAAGAAAPGNAMTPAGADLSAEFSFFPGAAPISGSNTKQAAGVTPEMPVAGSAGLGQSHPMDSNISPEILGFYEQQQQQQAQDGMGSSRNAAGAPAMPRSIIKSGKSLNEAGTPVLGRAQRVPAGADAVEAPPTITKELRALMADLKLDDPAGMKEMGTVSTLSPVRTTGSLRGFLGGLARAITPVRRSARKRTPGKPLEAMLEETGYSYVPNAAMMAEDAQPKLEAAEAKQARKAASRATSQATSEPSLAGGVAAAAEAGQPEVTSTARAGTLEAEQELAAQVAAAAAASSTPTAEPAASSRRMSLRRLRTPAQATPGTTPGEAVTPKQAHATPAGDVPVEQDASPQLGESPGLGAGAGTAEAPRRSYSLRPSTLKKKARQSVGTPMAAAAEGGAKGQGAEGGAKEQAQGRGTPLPQLSPTEQGIRASLRRSARKSKAPK